MIPFLLPYIARIGVPQRLQRAAAWLIALIIAAAIAALCVWAFWRWVGHREQRAVQADRVDVTMEAANRVIAATEAADVNQVARDERAQDNAKELQREVDTKGSDDVAGPAVSGVLDRVRQQQAAGRRN
ncbi:hypothetical protein [Sphingomonas sp. DC1100-1]|uniref:hypothetical protein n=1 Tax=unclassified Sphingomonas TaxID=196159 RepID=UPI003CF5E718